MLLRRQGSDPRPAAAADLEQFLKAQASGILACDFFTVETALPEDALRAVLHRDRDAGVHITAQRAIPDSAFVAQQARNLAIEPRRARRAVASSSATATPSSRGSFDEVFAAEGIRVIRTPISAPNANAFAERWVRRSRRLPGLDADPRTPASRSGSARPTSPTTTGSDRIEDCSSWLPRGCLRSPHRRTRRGSSASTCWVA